MSHTYTEIMGQGGIDRIIQKHTRRGRRRVMPDQPDYLAAKAEEGQPRIKVSAYVPKPPRPEETALQRAVRKLKEADLKLPRGTEDLFEALADKGVLVNADVPTYFLNLWSKKKQWRKTIRDAAEQEEA